MKKTSAIFSLVLLVLLFAGLVVVNNQLLSTVRADLTENQVYSLSQGSKDVLGELDEPITLYYFFSDSTSKGMTSLRNYADRVRSLLEEYEQASNGKVRLEVIDPEPFSEAEDKANQLGLTGATIGPVGEAIYFGLAGTNALDDHFSIAFFDPQKEQFLEYDISKLIYQLSDPEPVTVALVTDLPVTGGQNPMTGQFSPAMVFYEQLAQLYDVQVVSSSQSDLPEGTDVVILAHPKGLSESLAYAVDQFAMHQGRILAFVDPHYESDPMSMMGSMGANQSELPMLQKWGVEVLPEVVLDAQLGLDIRAPSGGIVMHPGILGLTSQNLNREDVTTANLESINGASMGAIQLAAKSQLKLETLASSSDNATLMPADLYAQTQDPEQLQRNLGAAPQSYVVAARVTGSANSAFEQAMDDDVEFVAATDKLNLVLVSDADWLADRFWVQQSNFFGQTIFTPFANNGDFVTNAAENLAGSNALISVRSRGTFARPFTRVQSLELQAEARFREQEERLQAQLAQTEEQLAQLQSQPGQGGALVLTQEQQAAIDEFVEQRVAIRKELRDVRYQLERDIDRLGNWLKFLNIAVAPLLLVIVLFGLAKLFRRRAGKEYRGEAL
ncbi:ABC transporter [Alteromonas aestuariivivens]|uniref:ABC transporter n=1 Tax=Alteromonas aestuariivivens TaxID=1938339 RepID=A0A3D8MFK8_9ALTE|nr:GldG family protein [Alteromonas aestuariivivens]RDV29294.1 ABC transporter [Alteromonas aestuariivivens]